jgi:hypothetical protein
MGRERPQSVALKGPPPDKSKPQPTQMG